MKANCLRGNGKKKKSPHFFFFFFDMKLLPSVYQQDYNYITTHNAVESSLASDRLT